MSSNIEDNNLPSWLKGDPTPAALAAEVDEDDEIEVNLITGSVRPEQFEIGNDKPLCDALYRVRQEVPWLKGENYDFRLNDIQEAIWLVTELSVVMQVGLNDLLGAIAGQYTVAQGDIPHSERLPRPKYSDLLDLELAQDGFDLEP